MKKLFAIICMIAFVLGMAGCGEKEEETTTLTGMVVSVDGTVISLREMDSQNQGNFSGGRPSGFGNGQSFGRPEGMEDFTMPEDFEGSMPEGFDPENFGGSMPEGFDPESFGGSMPEGFDPESFGGSMPPQGQMPNMEFGDMAGETTTVDIANAHISVEIDGGKASGSMEDITAGVFVTITLNGKGEATYVLVSANSGFGGNFWNRS